MGRWHWTFCSLVGTGMLCFALACGPKPHGKKPSPGGRATIEKSFAKAAKDYGIPLRYLMAVGYMESRFSPEPATTIYPVETQPEAPQALGTILTQTAFGVPIDALGLDPNQESSYTLETQVEAYARWLKESLENANVKLPADPQTAEDRFYWIENIAMLQRKGVSQRRNVQIVFARELIQTLNQGFIWQDPRDGSKIKLEPEAAPLSPDVFPPNARNWLQLSELDAQLYLATYLPLVTVPTGEVKNTPRRIEVIHCPMSLSACLEWQTRSSESQVKLAAHFVIPPDRTIFSKVLQVADQSEALTLTSPDGREALIQDAVIIMLTGASGRPVQGVRQPAVPTWFGDSQLRSMGQLINDLCTLLSQRNPAVQRDACMSIGGDQGIRFRTAAADQLYRWGDIPDFEPNIFEAYVRSPSGLSSEVAIEFDKSLKAFNAGEAINLTILLDPQARTVEVERLARCPGAPKTETPTIAMGQVPKGVVVWEPARTKQIRNEKRLSFQEAYYDAGPNGNGEQFFRIRVYGKDTRLLGWSIAHVYLQGYETDLALASEKYCRMDSGPRIVPISSGQGIQGQRR